MDYLTSKFTFLDIKINNFRIISVLSSNIHKNPQPMQNNQPVKPQTTPRAPFTKKKPFKKVEGRWKNRRKLAALKWKWIERGNGDEKSKRKEKKTNENFHSRQAAKARAMK